MDIVWAQLQTYTKTYTSSPLSVTRGPPHVVIFFLSSSSLSIPTRSRPRRAAAREQQQHAAGEQAGEQQRAGLGWGQGRGRACWSSRGRGWDRACWSSWAWGWGHACWISQGQGHCSAQGQGHACRSRGPGARGRPARDSVEPTVAPAMEALVKLDLRRIHGGGGVPGASHGGTREAQPAPYPWRRRSAGRRPWRRRRPPPGKASSTPSSGVRGHDSGSSARPQARSRRHRQRSPWPRQDGERAEERDEERKKKMTRGAHVSVTEEMKYTSSYTSAAGLRLCPYVFSDIFI